MADINRHGLSRDIPDPIKRTIRQRCGFGCVVCGSAVYQYEHLDPTFAEATEHNSDKIVLLCGGCHDRVTRGLLSKHSVARASTSPQALRTGFSFGAFDVGDQHPDVVLGTLVVKRTDVIVRVLNEPIFEVKAPEAPGGPFQLSALMRDIDGREILRISDNEWQTPIENWDVEVVGPRITIRRGPGDIALRIRTDPPHTLTVERLTMVYNGLAISCTEGQNLRVQAHNQQFETFAASVDKCQIAIDIREESFVIGYRCEDMHIGSAIVGPPTDR